ncbi:MAG: efflux transporter outer membrane subunit [Gammaproteobacteria bacterium]
MRLFALGCCLAALAGCAAIGPDYVRPEVDTPQAWRVDYQQATGMADTRWWAQFNDPVLNQLIETALRENYDVRIATARIEQFLGQLRTARSTFYPQIGAAAATGGQRETETGPGALPSNVSNPFNFYEAQLNTNWEIDVFGRIRRATESARAQVFSAEEIRRAVILSVVTGVASSYIALRALDRQLEISHATARNYGQTKRIFDLRFEAGIVARVEVAQVESQYQDALAAIPAFERLIALQENLLSILLGRNPAPILRGRAIDQLALPGIPSGLPSSLLDRRPDIRAAEQDLIAANAQIGVARSLYFPTISLTGLVGTASASLTSLFTGPASVWELTAAATAPVFTFGNIEGQVQAAEAVQRQALERYRQTIQGAFREVNDALVSTQKSREELEARGLRVAALKDFARLSQQRFDEGVTSYLEVLIAQNELFGAELAHAQNQADSLTQLVNVYKAVGGGWVIEAERIVPLHSDRRLSVSGADRGERRLMGRTR